MKNRKKVFCRMILVTLAVLALSLMAGCDPEPEAKNGTPISAKEAESLGEPQIAFTTSLLDTVSDSNVPMLTCYVDTRDYGNIYADWGDGGIVKCSLWYDDEWNQYVQGKLTGDTVKLYSDDNITVFQCQGELTSLDVSGCISLKELNVSHNALTNLNLYRNQSLETLNCSFNALETLDVTDNQYLYALNCQSNPLIRLSPGKKNTFLTELNCSDTQLETLDLSPLTGLKTLVARRCQLRSLELHSNKKLQHLYIDGNTKIHALDLTNNFELASLTVKYTNLDSLDLSQNTALTSLDFSESGLTDLDLSRSTALQTLCCDSNRLTQLDISHNTALETLSCRDNTLTELDISQNTALLTLDCSNNALTSLDTSRNRKLQFLYCQNNALTSLDLRENEALRKLDYRGNDEMTAPDYSHNEWLHEVNGKWHRNS